MLSKSVVKSESPGNNYGFGGRLHAILVQRVFNKSPPPRPISSMLPSLLLHYVSPALIIFSYCDRYPDKKHLSRGKDLF